MSEELEKFTKSGRILAQVREFVKRLPIQNKPLLEICEQVEGKIREFGVSPAFPCNVGVNEVAAHYTSPWNDSRLVPENSLVKIDFGVELDGYITDTAVTIALNPAYDSMIVAAETALQEALSAIAPGRKLSDIGSVVERCVKRYGFKPIRNLTGHKIDRYAIHAGQARHESAVNLCRLIVAQFWCDIASHSPVWVLVDRGWDEAWNIVTDE